MDPGTLCTVRTRRSAIVRRRIPETQQESVNRSEADWAVWPPGECFASRYRDCFSVA